MGRSKGRKIPKKFRFPGYETINLEKVIERPAISDLSAAVPLKNSKIYAKRTGQKIFLTILVLIVLSIIVLSLRPKPSYSPTTHVSSTKHTVNFIDEQLNLSDARDKKIQSILGNDFIKNKSDNPIDTLVNHMSSFIVKDRSKSTLTRVDTVFKYDSSDPDTIVTSVAVLNVEIKNGGGISLDGKVMNVLKAFDSSIDNKGVTDLLYESMPTRHDIPTFYGSTTFGETKISIFGTIIDKVGHLTLEATKIIHKK